MLWQILAGHKGCLRDYPRKRSLECFSLRPGRQTERAAGSLLVPSRVVLRYAAALVTTLALVPTVAESASPWRFWNSTDGLTESYVTSITPDQSGRLIVKHGNVPFLNVLDGYGTVSIPDSHALGRVIPNPDGTLWSLNRAGIEIYEAGRWKTYPVPEIGTFFRQYPSLLDLSWFRYSSVEGLQLPFRADMFPSGLGSAWILLPDRLLEWQVASGRTTLIRLAAQTALTRFHDLQPARDGGVWVSGATGLGHLTRDGAGFRWVERRAPSWLSDLSLPVEAGPEDVFISGTRISGTGADGERTLARWKNNEWQTPYAGEGTFLRGWPGPDGSTWVQQGSRLLQLSNGHLQTIERPEVLSGTVLDVITQPGGVFWVGTTQGIARYSPPLWHTPAAVQSVDGLINAIVEDSEGRLWFLGDRFLLVNDQGRWESFPLPQGRRHRESDSEALAVLQNGSILIHTDSEVDFSLFNPKLRSFSTIRHPGNNKLGHFTKHSKSGVWVQVFDGDLPWHLESFDGTDFRPADPSLAFTMKDPRTFLETRGEDLWIAGTDGLTLWRKGKLRKFGTKDGFTDTGVFSAFETAAGTILIGGRNYITEYDGKSFRILQQGVDRARSVCVGPDGGLWIASGDGIHRTRAGDWFTETAEDGLPSSAAYKMLCDKQGRVWAGTTRGLSLFDPNADPDPPIAGIDEGQNLRETPPGGEVRLAFWGRDKWKHTTSDRLLFSHRVDDGTWSAFSPERLTSLTGLRAGKHRFQVRAMDRNGNISPNPAVFEFSVLLSWYRQMGFLALAGLALFVIGLLLRLAWLHHRTLAFQSRHDPLTRLPNRVVFENGLQQAITQARRNATGVAILLLDLDGFKRINDTLGHGVGDRYLCTVASRLRACIRKSDTVARIGGDEFGIILPGLRSQHEAESVAEKILAAMREASRINSYELNCSASIGLSLFPEHGDDPATLQRLADIAMYHCKGRRKNDYMVFDATVNGLDFQTSRVAQMILEALRGGYFRLHYQPLEYADGELASFEALIRMEHPELGLIPPDDFISVAEQSGLIVPIGQWVLEEACLQLSRWRAAGHWPLNVAVNVSSLQLSKPDFIDVVTGVLERAALPPSALTLEITERTIIANWDQARTQLEYLRAIGCRIVIDDFGTGYSSLSSLHLLPVDDLKLDCALVQHIGEDEKCLLVLDGIIRLAHNLGQRVVAEGVETGAQACALRSLRCDILQGFWIGRPVPAEEIDRLLAAGTMEILTPTAS
jgi:diguanylate cyclase (GGDEF)-like protein